MDAQLLQNLAPINTLKPEQINTLAGKASLESANAGLLLFKQGDNDKKHFYVIEGEVELLDDKRAVVQTIAGGSEEGNKPLAHNKPRTLNARSKTAIKFIRIDSDYLDLLMTWDQTGMYSVEDLAEDEEDEDTDWMSRMLQNQAFENIPPANIQALFMRMESISFKVGDQVIKQGGNGDYFYMITKGRCLVTRATPTKPNGVKLAELNAGDSFGEEALISDTKRNATITMLSPGEMMRLSKEDFISLMNEPMQNWIAFEDSVQLITQEKAVWLDVRLPDEFKTKHIKGAMNIPLILLRAKADALDTNRPYMLYCDTGRRSSAAAFLLAEKGFNIYVLKDGLASVPETACEGAA